MELRDRLIYCWFWSVVEFFDNKKNLFNFKAVPHFSTGAASGTIPFWWYGPFNLLCFRALCLDFYTHLLLKTSRWIKPDSPKGLYHVIGLCALYNSHRFQGPQRSSSIGLDGNVTLDSKHISPSTSRHFPTQTTDIVNSKSQIFNELVVSFIPSFFLSSASGCFIRHWQNGAE